MSDKDQKQQKLEKRFGPKYDVNHTQFKIGDMVAFMKYPFNKTDKMLVGELMSYGKAMGETNYGRFRLSQGVVVTKEREFVIENYPERLV